MNESQSLGVQCLSRAQLKAILDELLVFRIDGALSYLRSAVPFVIEQRMPDIIHMYADLVRPSGFKTAFHHGYIAESFNYAVMRHCVLALVPVRIYFESEPVVRVPADIAGNGSLVLFQIAPDDCNVFPFNGMPEKLACKVKL